jgi:branched-chain amino acid transport system permease protein
MPSFGRGRGASITFAALIAAAIALLPLFVRDIYTQNILILTLMYAALSQSWNILSGYCGQISLGHALYFGLGAYVSRSCSRSSHHPPIGMVAGGPSGHRARSAILLALGGHISPRRS